ncbi:radical SAM protein [Methanospirillum purgamenti]|uniref:Radical SAM protein n=1 Tax=Methanospirillum hungatei TaxID=2203 RepID=A0A8F5ZG06_METHU|nr:radical SAM protein [Methanospirillum hungatei]QXO93974.1 radical SAM protein [Methanospirillum hungatei]
MDDSFTAEIKAKLISIGSVRLDPALELPEYVGRSTAGPSAGGRSVFFTADSRRVRLSIRDNSPLFIRLEGEGVAIFHDGSLVATGMLEPVGAHCPHQAYITVSERCIFHCAFCPVHRIQGPVKSQDEVLSLVDEAYARGNLQAISLTAGIEASPDHEVDRMECIVTALRKQYDIPIGVSVYPTYDSSERLYAAGADEIKYNVETMDADIFSIVCPEQDLDFILNSLLNAVRIFGKNKVSSNSIIGLGESDETVISGLETITGLGVLPVLRPVVIHPTNPLPGAERPSAERLLKLGKAAKEAMNRHGLTPLNARTMCVPCTGCDLTPVIDF